ncbi:MAG: glycerol-3-phosphate acyltransferase [Pleurocapsa minor GSE-CHR-MK-17-07R]|jgi:glycerol-3-phosphate acyltransferase PlsY|nr:glycerol-3-phosphate acyltransferase [Pleurocapsa minor GSE-CHR-MK 17-07R]
MIVPMLVFTALGFFSGSLMFSYWLGKRMLGKDITTVGDGNPGTFNVFKAGGKAVGALAFLLDVLKGTIPVAIARYGFGLYGWELLPVALAPVFGHAFSPFMGWRGGKAVAVAFGVYMAITLWEMPVITGLTLGLYYTVIGNSGVAILMTSLTALVYILLFDAYPVLIAYNIASSALILWKYRADFREPLALRGWIRRRLWPSKQSV